MEGTASTSNEKNNKRDLEKYKKVNVKKVKDIDKALSKKGFDDLDIFCAMAFDVKENEKSKNDSSSAVNSSSEGSKKFELDDIRENGVKISISHNYTPENEPKFNKKRAEAKKKKEEEKEAREVEEAKKLEEINKNQIEIENNIVK